MLKTVSSISNTIGALNYKGTWNASTNSPSLTSGAGTKGDYYVVSVAGSTTLDGISNWGVGDWAAYNGSVWQRVEGGADLNGVNLSVSGTTTLSGLTASTALALNASKEVVSVTNTGTGNNVLAVSPTFTGTPVFNNVGAAGYAVEITGNDQSNVRLRLTNGGGGGQTYELVGGFPGANNSAFSLFNVTAGNTPFSMDSSGNLTIFGGTATKATGTTWSNPSDQRLKDNIRDYRKGVAELMQIRVREWEYNGKGGTVAGTKGLGVVADEAMLVLPETVDNYEAKLDTTDEELTTIKKFDATEITWLLVKALQELKLEFDAYKNSHP
jgi:hypothetical protein